MRLPFRPPLHLYLNEAGDDDAGVVLPLLEVGGEGLRGDDDLFRLGGGVEEMEVVAGTADRDAGVGDVETFLMGGDGEDVPRGDLSFQSAISSLGRT